MRRLPAFLVVPECRSSCPGLWAVFFAAGAAWVVGKISLGLRSDYLAIATLGISEIIIYFLKFEEWLTRGVKNVTGLPGLFPMR